MKRLLVNDMLSALPDHRTFWNDLMEWFDMEFIGAPFAELADKANGELRYFDTNSGWQEASLIIRNATYFGPIEKSETIPTISLLQDIMGDGPQREMQEAVILISAATVFNSNFTMDKYRMDYDSKQAKDMRLNDIVAKRAGWRVIPLPVDFNLFEPGNPMGLQQALSLPDNCICWVGASQGAAAQVKGWDIFLSIVRQNPDLHFVAVFKDAMPEYVPPNMRAFVRVSHEELVKIIGACRVGLCTSRMESQHLAGIEMGACGLPMVAPPVGTYFGREEFPGRLVNEPTVENFTSALRVLVECDGGYPEVIREYWQKDFDRPIIRSAWEKLIEEVECQNNG